MSGVASALRLGLFGIVVAAVLAGVDAGTHERIEANSQRAIVKSLIELTGDIRLSTLTGPLVPPLEICTSATTSLYDVRAISIRGYGGPISLLVAIDASDRLVGVRVVSHHETPGIGDVIETGRSGWILDFGARHSDDIDGVTGATITTRAVIAAVDAATIDHRNGPPARCTHVLSD